MLKLYELSFPFGHEDTVHKTTSAVSFGWKRGRKLSFQTEGKQQYQKCSVVDALKAVSAAPQSELERVPQWKSSVAGKQTPERQDFKFLITKKYEQI